jgi:hypothetical protein
MRCIKAGCGSHAINEHLYDRVIGVDSNLCDVHYWQKRADRIVELEHDAARYRWLRDNCGESHIGIYQNPHENSAHYMRRWLNEDDADKTIDMAMQKGAKGAI